MSRVIRAILFVLLALFTLVFGFLLSLPHKSLLDFGSFIASGRAAAQGLDPYGIYPLVLHIQLGNVDTYARNLNPPISLLVFQAISQWNPTITYWAWYVISFALYALVIVLLARAYPRQATALRILWALSLAGFWYAQLLGQVYVPLALASTGAWLLLRKERYISAGLLIGLVVAIKPNFLVWPALLLLGGYWLTAIAAVACALALSLIPALVYGPNVYVEWLRILPPLDSSAPANGSLLATFGRLRMPAVGIVVAAALLLGLAYWAKTRRPPALRLSALALDASLLTSPIAWAGYTMVLLPVFFARRWSRTMLISALLLLFPAPLIWIVSLRTMRVISASLSGGARPGPALLVNLIVASIYCLALLVVLVALVREPVSRDADPVGSASERVSQGALPM